MDRVKLEITSLGQEAYLLWDFESIKEVRFDVIKYDIVSLYADHCAEEKKKDVNITAHHDLNEIGHNTATWKTYEAEVQENYRKAAEAKKAQSKAAKAHSLRNKQNLRKLKKSQTLAASSSEQAQPKKRGRLVQNKAGDHTQSHQQPPKETTQKKRTGRPPKPEGLKYSTSN
ncbi:hypothetical protein ACET3Z_005606 [Daucus carota]